MRWLVLLAAWGCASRPRVPDEAPARIEPPRIARVPRPVLRFEPFDNDLSALTAEDLRWPLTRAPSLQPHLAISSLYRTTASWISLCEARRDPVAGVDRDELVDYLQAWCAGTDLGLRDRLQPLATAKTLQIARAARLDLVDVVALQPIPAREAASWLQTVFFDRTTLDALAATYEVLGRTGDERVILEMQMQSPWWGHTADCRVMYRARRLTGFTWIRDDIEERKPYEPTCEYIADALDREDPVRHCVLIAREHPSHDVCDVADCTRLEHELRGCGPLASSSRARLAIAYLHWPGDHEHDPLVWRSYARFVRAVNDPAAELLANAALENARRLAR